MTTYPSAASAGRAATAQMNKVGVAVNSAQHKAVDLASAALSAGVRASAPARLRNVGKRGAALSVAYRTVGSGGHPESHGRAIGPWAIIEYDTPSHLIGIGKSGRKRARVRVRNDAAVGGYLEASNGKYKHGVRGPIVHPGTHGKHVFHKGVAAATPAAKAVLRRVTVEAVKGSFK